MATSWNTLSNVIKSNNVGELKKVRYVLLKATNLLSKGWCRDYSALDKNGKEVIAESKSAVRFCSMGAIDASCKRYDMLKRSKLRRLAANVLASNEVLGKSNGGVIYFNDCKAKDKREVVRKFKKAVTLLGKALETGNKK